MAKIRILKLMYTDPAEAISFTASLIEPNLAKLMLMKLRTKEEKTLKSILHRRRHKGGILAFEGKANKKLHKLDFLAGGSSTIDGSPDPGGREIYHITQKSPEGTLTAS